MAVGIVYVSFFFIWKVYLEKLVIQRVETKTRIQWCDMFFYGPYYVDFFSPCVYKKN